MDSISSDTSTRLYKEHYKKESDLQTLKERHINNVMQECTFRPKIDKKSEMLANHKKMDQLLFD